MAETDETILESSILKTIKKLLNIPADYDAFDQDVITHINSSFFTLQQLGVIPEDGFEITSSSNTWAELLAGDKNLNGLKSYIYIRVRLLFDPPPTSYAIDSFKKQADEFEWRLQVQKDPLIFTKNALENTDD